MFEQADDRKETLTVESSVVHVEARASDRFPVFISVLCFLLVAGSIAALFLLGYLHTWALAVEKLPWIWGQLIFLLFFIESGQPFGWGCSLFQQLSGFIFGWPGLLTTEFGMIIAGTLGFLSSRYCLRKWALGKIHTFPPKTRKVVDAAQKTLSAGKSSLLFFTSIRMTPALTYGWTNGICGAMTDMNIGLYLTTMVLGIQMSCVVQTYLGVVLRQFSDAVAKGDTDDPSVTTRNVSQQNISISTPSSGNIKDVQTIVLIVQIIMAIILLIMSTLWSRHVFKKVLMGTDAAQQEEENPKSSTISTQNE